MFAKAVTTPFRSINRLPNTLCRRLSDPMHNQKVIKISSPPDNTYMAEHILVPVVPHKDD
ncbi:hypothetical protein H4Q26_012982 [Puccinia striiformis f. sp. tritici PST-130]|nr:hypothetical protein H4Q26_012982 [Puccinia striiformis f. sp. tritici PST-130]